MAISLQKVFQGSTSYATDHEANYTAIEAAHNALELLVTGPANQLSVPLGLQEIFDRRGIIGYTSYEPDDNGGAALPGNNLTIAEGAYWNQAEFRSKTTSTVLSMAAFSTATLYVDIPTGGVPIVVTSVGVDTVWQFDYNATTDIVTAVVRYSTCNVLFDGDDYNAQLSGYDSVAQRLDAIEGLAGVLGTYYGEDVASHSGLNFAYLAGKVRNDNVITATVAGTTLLVNAVLNYIEVHPGTGVVSDNVVGFTSGRIPLFTVTPSGGNIAGVVDMRTWAGAGGGGGGGHAQNTDLGTDAAEFKLNRLQAGAPSLNASFKAERGSSPDVDIRWNEATDKWEFTTDGSTYEEIGSPGSFDPGAQQITKYVAKLDPPIIIERLAIGTDGAYVDTNLGPSGTNVITDAPNGCQALVLRVQFWDSDSTPADTVNVKFKQYNGAASPTKAWTVWADGVSEHHKVQTLIVPGDDGGVSPIVGLSHLVTASGAGAANVRVFLQGYMVKVTGVGSQTKEFTSTANVVAAATTTNFNKTGFVNRGLSYNLTMTETGGLVTGTYNVSIYKKDTFLAADLLYSAVAIDPTAASRIYTDRLPFMYLDGDSTSELHIKIQNNDGVQSGTWTIAITLEQFL